MAIAPALIAAMMAQSAFSLALDPVQTESTEAGYEQLENGEPRAAIAAIEAAEGVETSDPAALINLGNAYARLGKTDRAMAYYQAAIDSRDRYELELADGTWMDSRRAAREAMKALKLTTTMQAMAD